MRARPNDAGGYLTCDDCGGSNHTVSPGVDPVAVLCWPCYVARHLGPSLPPIRRPRLIESRSTGRTVRETVYVEGMR